MSAPAPRSSRARRPVADPVPAGRPWPGRLVARGWTGGPLPLGLDLPLDLRGGDSMPPGGMPATLPLDWCPDLLDLVADECRRRLADGRGWFGLPPLALVDGTPVAGHVGAAIALHAGVPLVRLDLGGGVAGPSLRRGTVGPEVALPSRLVLHMAASRCANPVVLVEGAAQSSGEALTALTSMVDPRTADRWVEDAIGATVDLSHATWLVAVDRLESLPLPLERLLRPIRVGAHPSAAEDELLLLSMVDEVATSMGVGRAEAAGHWRAMLTERSWRQARDLVAMRKAIEVALRG